MVDGETGLDDGRAQVRNIRDPGQPTANEHKEHVMGRGVNSPHRRSGAQDDLEGVPHVLVLVIHERRHKMPWAMLAPRKGTEIPWIVKRSAKFIYQLGHNRDTHRRDNELAIQALSREISARPKIA